MKKLSILTLIMFTSTIAFSSFLWAAGTCVVSNADCDNFSGVCSRIANWTSDATNGDVSAATLGIIANCNGTLTDVIVRRDTTDEPTDNYDFYLFDEDDIDVLGGDGVDMDASPTTATLANKYLHPLDSEGGSINFRRGNLRIAIINAGNAKKGTITLMFE